MKEIMSVSIHRKPDEIDMLITKNRFLEDGQSPILGTTFH